MKVPPVTATFFEPLNMIEGTIGGRELYGLKIRDDGCGCDGG